MGQQFSSFFLFSLRSFWLDTNNDTGNHELCRIPHGVDIVILITQKSTGLAQSSKVLEF